MQSIYTHPNGGSDKGDAAETVKEKIFRESFHDVNSQGIMTLFTIICHHAATFVIEAEPESKDSLTGVHVQNEQ